MIDFEIIIPISLNDQYSVRFERFIKENLKDDKTPDLPRILAMWSRRFLDLKPPENQENPISAAEYVLSKLKEEIDQKYHKVCTKCKQNLPATEFYSRPDPRSKDGLFSACKTCTKGA